MEQPKAINNPMLVGAMELLKADNSTNHRDFFLQELLKAHLLTPATVTPRPEPDETGRMRMLPDSQIGFSMLNTREGMRFFMAFTDMQELKKWVKKMEADQHLFVFRFHDYAGMVERAGSQCDGFAINPGGANILVTRRMIDAIQGTMAVGKPPKDSQ